MRGSCLAALAALALARPGLADDKLPGPPPHFVTVQNVDRKAGEITFAELTMHYVAREVTREVVQDGKKVPVKETVYVPEFRTGLIKYSVADGQVYDGAGKKLDADEVWKRATVGAAVLLSSDFRMVDDAYLKLLNKDALVFVPALPKAPPPPPPMTKGR